MKPAAWYRDPVLPGTLRWWDGGTWTQFTTPEPAAGLPAPAPPMMPTAGNAGDVRSPSVPTLNPAAVTTPTAATPMPAPAVVTSPAAPTPPLSPAAAAPAVPAVTPATPPPGAPSTPAASDGHPAPPVAPGIPASGPSTGPGTLPTSGVDHGNAVAAPSPAFASDAALPAGWPSEPGTWTAPDDTLTDDFAVDAEWFTDGAPDPLASDDLTTVAVQEPLSERIQRLLFTVTRTDPDSPTAVRTAALTAGIAVAVLIGIVGWLIVKPAIPPIVWLIPVIAAGIWFLNKWGAGREWRTIHKTVLAAVAAAGHDEGMRWSAPCQWLPTPGDPSDDNREPFNGVIALFDEGIAWFPAPVADGDTPHHKQRPWTVPASNVALVHRSKSGVGDGFDVHGRDSSVRCLQIPPGFLGDAIDTVNAIGYRLLDD